jgi:hypothetical protein
MENKIITNHAELVLRIAELKMNKDLQEYELQNTFKEVVSTLNLVSLFKAATNQDHPLEIAKSGVNMVLDLIIDVVLGKHRSIKGYLSAVMVERFTSLLIDNNLINIISGISSLFKRKSQYEKSQEQNFQ